MLRVGLTGGIASGKSRVARIFQERGIPVIDTDQLSRDILAPGAPLLAEVLRRFGTDLCRSDGSLDRTALRARVFADPRLRARLEALTHPAIAAAMEDRVQALPAGTPYVVLVIPLLLEAGWQDRVDRILVVDCPEAVQAERLMARDGIDADTAWAMIRSQASRAVRRQAADDILDNGASGDLDALTQRVQALDHRYRAGTGA
jgi:dephospho-CoA kinase